MQQEIMDTLTARSYSSFVHLEAAMRLALTCKGTHITFKETPAVCLVKNKVFKQYYTMTNRDMDTHVHACMYARYINNVVHVDIIYPGFSYSVKYTKPHEFEDMIK